MPLIGHTTVQLLCDEQRLIIGEMALVQTRLHRAMMRNAIVQPDRRSVQRTALRPTDHHFVRELVHELQTELAGSGDHDGGSGDLRDPYHDPTVGSALPSRIRKALAALRSARRRIVEDGRDVYIRFTDKGCICTGPSTKQARRWISPRRLE